MRTRLTNDQGVVITAIQFTNLDPDTDREVIEEAAALGWGGEVDGTELMLTKGGDEMVMQRWDWLVISAQSQGPFDKPLVLESADVMTGWRKLG